jgi:ribosome maturation factor RimP
VTTAASQLHDQIERTLSERLPDVEVVLAERLSPGLVRVYIDREPGGVDTDLCERVSRELAPLRERYRLEVSSPGLDRPLTRPRHFRRVVGQTIAVRTAEPIDGRRQFSGPLTAADDSHCELDQDGSTVRIPYAAIRRSHLVYDPAGGRP